MQRNRTPKTEDQRNERIEEEWRELDFISEDEAIDAFVKRDEVSSDDAIDATVDRNIE